MDRTPDSAPAASFVDATLVAPAPAAVYSGPRDGDFVDLGLNTSRRRSDYSTGHVRLSSGVCSKGHVIEPPDRDHPLFERALAGDDTAREELFVRAFATMQPAVARRLGSGHPDVGDVATDAWIRFHGNWRSWSGRVSWERFAYGFARNTVMDYWRRVERRREDVLIVDPRSGFDLEAHCAAREFAGVLRVAVAGLPTRQKQVFELHRDGLRQAEIAARLDIARATVAVTLRNARFALLHELLEKGYDWPPDGSYLEI